MVAWAIHILAHNNLDQAIVSKQRFSFGRALRIFDFGWNFWLNITYFWLSVNGKKTISFFLILLKIAYLTKFKPTPCCGAG